MTPTPGAVAAAWAAARLPSEVVHLDIAGAGRVSAAVFEAEVRHLREEARVGGYVAEGEATAVTEAGRDGLGRLLGLDGSAVAWSDGAASAFATTLAGWPLGRGARVGTVASDYSANVLSLRLLADARGWQLVPLPVDDLGRIQAVPAGLDLLTFPQIASQRGVVQPVAEILRSGTPVLLDVAQSLGQTPVPPGCAGYVGTSRKWLCGPRGVGFLAVDPAVLPSVASPPLLPSYDDVRRLDVHEAHVAGRVGLSVAVGEWAEELLPCVHERAAYARQVLAGSGWHVVEPVREPSGITTVTGGDPFAIRAALLEDGILVNAVPQTRAPDLTGPVLRVSTGAWVQDSDLDLLVERLGSPVKA
jgi:pyridoxal 5-phosphate dependent beta-lyase